MRSLISEIERLHDDFNALGDKFPDFAIRHHEGHFFTDVPREAKEQFRSLSKKALALLEKEGIHTGKGQLPEVRLLSWLFSDDAKSTSKSDANAAKTTISETIDSGFHAAAEALKQWAESLSPKTSK